MSFFQVLCEETTSMWVGDHFKANSSLTISGPREWQCLLNTEMFTTYPTHARFGCIPFYWTTQSSLRITASICWITTQINGNVAQYHALQNLRLHLGIAPGIHTYQFVGMLTRCCLVGSEHFQTQIIYQLKSTLYRGHIRAICSKCIIINVHGSCRKLYDSKAF